MINRTKSHQWNHQDSTMKDLKTPSLLIVMAIAALFIGGFELAITRAASVLFYHDIAYLTLSLSLLSLGVGALISREFIGQERIPHLITGQIFAMAACSVLLPEYEIAWVLGLFCLPFAIFGALATNIWRALPDIQLRQSLYLIELGSTALGLLWLGPLLVTLLPLNPFNDVGFQTHLKETVAREGFVANRHITSTYARTDLLETNNDAVKYIFTDGMYVTRSVQWDGQSAAFESPLVEDLARLKRLALRSTEPDKVALLGAGAGFDIAVALQEGASSIDAVEINPATITFGRELDPWAGGVFSNQAVTIHETDARRFMQQTDQHWNHISLTLLQTSPATARGRQHADARVLTVEAVETYLPRLSPGGTLAIIQNTLPLANATNNVLQAAIPDGTNHILNFQLADSSDNPFHFLTIASNEPFSPEEITSLRNQAENLKIEYRTPENSPRQSPATDDRPYFFESTTIWSLQTGLAALVATLIVAINLLLHRHHHDYQHFGLLATIVGACTMAAQFIALYWCQAAIGHPTLALSVALSAMLGGAGIGVLIVGHRFGREHSYASGLLAALAIGLLLLVAPCITEITVHETENFSALIMGSFIFCCSIPLGLPFFSAMHQASASTHLQQGEGLVIGFDGIGGVLGATTATLIAITMGFTVLTWVVITGYLVFAIITTRHISQ